MWCLQKIFSNVEPFMVYLWKYKDNWNTLWNKTRTRMMADKVKGLFLVPLENLCKGGKNKGKESKKSFFFLIYWYKGKNLSRKVLQDLLPINLKTGKQISWKRTFHNTLDFLSTFFSVNFSLNTPKQTTQIHQKRNIRHICFLFLEKCSWN